MSLILACVLTVLIETGFFMLCGYRSREKIAVIVCANIVSNLAINLLLSFVIPYSIPAVLALELAVLAFEYAVYALAFARSGRLFLLTLLANLISFAVGGFLMRLIAFLFFRTA